MTARKTAYDAIPYDSHPFPQSWPDRLAAVARLFDLETPDPARCRVLELGCSLGGNLISMAQPHPGSQYLGIDSSSRQIAEGWKIIDALGLKNVQLKQLDILEVGEELGTFDYIICHGVFSWVPPAVQDRILELCKRHLNANGVAYISYNTFPGWHIRGIVRDIMLYRGAQFTDPATRLDQAKSLVQFVAQSLRDESSPYKQLLQNELGVIGKSDDYYLQHEHLEENNHPLYFHEFARRLAVHGLQYLGEADFSTMVSTNFAPDVAKTLQELGAHDILQMEQYMDFVRCRYFRQTLVCHSAVRLNRRISARIVKGLHLSSSATAASPNIALGPDHPETFRTARGLAINCSSPLTKIALQRMAAQWPMPVRFDALFDYCRTAAQKEGFTTDSQAGEDFFAGEMLTSMAAGVVDWRLHAPAYGSGSADKPEASTLARFQATQGFRLTSLRGETITVDEFHRQVLLLLDGSRDVPAVTEALTMAVRKGTLELRRDGDSTLVTDEPQIRKLLATALQQALVNLGRQALLRA